MKGLGLAAAMLGANALLWTAPSILAEPMVAYRKPPPAVLVNPMACKDRKVMLRQLRKRFGERLEIRATKRSPAGTSWVEILVGPAGSWSIVTTSVIGNRLVACITDSGQDWAQVKKGPRL